MQQMLSHANENLGATSFGFSCQGQGSVFCETQWLKRIEFKFQIAGALNAPAPSYIK